MKHYHIGYDNAAGISEMKEVWLEICSASDVLDEVCHIIILSNIQKDASKITKNAIGVVA